MEGIIALLIPLAFVCIPIVAIVAKHREKIARMEIEAGITDSRGNKTTLENGGQKGSGGGRISDNRAQLLEDRMAAIEETVADMSSEMDKMSRHLEFNERLLESLGHSNQERPDARAENSRAERGIETKM